ncbi:hypothetical protein [Mesonia maritima]|uniref:Uncharacterized protein n=1 Tax=Mesonia maritima TaxID=1793873 RepID=A0ABU1K6R5_9FLAO|nr:hypothetical protein [Mesonia maritima]MDR6301294.1 hypothetical protein [Mesonia maritima]
MKNVLKFGMSLFMFTIVFISCSREDELEANDESAFEFNLSPNSVKLVTFNLNTGNNFSSAIVNSTQTVTMMSFPSIEEYETNVQMLEAQVETHEDDFMEEYNYLDEEELNNIEERSGFNSQALLIAFEETHNFPIQLKYYRGRRS